MHSAFAAVQTALGHGAGQMASSSDGVHFWVGPGLGRGSDGHAPAVTVVLPTLDRRPISS